MYILQLSLGTTESKQMVSLPDVQKADPMYNPKGPINKQTTRKDMCGMPKMLLNQSFYIPAKIAEQLDPEPTKNLRANQTFRLPMANGTDFMHQLSGLAYFEDEHGERVTPTENHNSIGPGRYRARVIKAAADGRCGRHSCAAGLVVSAGIVPPRAIELRREINARLKNDGWDTAEELARALAPTGVRLSVLETARYHHGVQPTRVLNFGTSEIGPVIHLRLRDCHFDLMVPDANGHYAIMLEEDNIINLPEMNMSDDAVLNAILCSTQETDPSNDNFDEKGNIIKKECRKLV